MSKYSNFKKLTLHEKYYLAGLFDGEGAVSLFRRKNLQHGEKTPSYYLVANITSTFIPLIKWIHKKLNGDISYHVPKNPKHSDYARWKVEGSRSINFLKQIYPYLKIKNRQCKIAFKFGKTINRTKGQKHKTPKKDLIYRDKLCNQMKKINRRGKQ
jgi:hypothetical protein